MQTSREARVGLGRPDVVSLLWRGIGLLACALLSSYRAGAASSSFVTFESGQVRPLALSPDGTQLFAVNTPDNRLEIFTLGTDGVTHAGAVSVGMEPVAVAARTNNEVWVVNHLSDSVSIVDVASGPPRVIRTLLVGDEPRDIVFAGPGGTRAFITTAHRGQNSRVDPRLLTPGVGRADVWVFDATDLGSSLGGHPLTIVTLYGDTPRALAVSPDGNTVYAAIFHSGNRTTIVPEALVCDGGQDAPPCEKFGLTMPGGLPAPNTNFEGLAQPETGLIVKWNPDNHAFEDALQRKWPVPISLPDKDVFTINAAATPPIETGFIQGVGTVIFNMAINPVSGTVYVTNSDAHNEVRFEGPGVFAGSSVRGHLHEARITVLRDGRVEPRHLNKHIDYRQVPSPEGVKERSLAIPLGMAVSSDGTTVYAAAYGSSKVGVFDTAELENDTFVPDESRHIPITGGGPSGLALDEGRGRLYVLTRFDNGLSVIETAERREVQHLRLYNSEPPSVVNGRPLLYDASYGSSNGEAACASCHVFGDFDSLAWDLGNPDGTVIPNPNPVKPTTSPAPFRDFYPLKGPMTTQTLRGLANQGPMHWRGDRTGGLEPGGDPFDEVAAFKQFDVGFTNLLGRAQPPSKVTMQAFADFVLQIVPPPNPIRALDNSLTPDQQIGRESFIPPKGDCAQCHVLDPARGFFGTDGSAGTNEMVPQYMKVPQLRNLYQKVGRFAIGGDDVRGFGFFHDGQGFTEQRVENVLFLFAIDSNLAPIVGQQITRDANSELACAGDRCTFGGVDERINLLVARADAGECDLVVKGTVAGRARGWYRTTAGTFQSDRTGEARLADLDLRHLASAPGQELTYTCVPAGSGVRVGIDRDEDGALDGDEIDAGTDPADPSSLPQGVPPTAGAATATPTPSEPAMPSPTRPSLPVCVGDCTADGQITVDELLRGVGIVLGDAPASDCPRFDANGDGSVTVDEILMAISNALNGCPPRAGALART